MKQGRGRFAAGTLGRAVLLAFLCGCIASGAAEAGGADSGNASVRALGGGLFGIGEVRLNKKERSVSFPGQINLREETIEYAVVHKTGKTHESLLRTDARPHDVHLAMLLLGSKPLMTNSFGADGKAVPDGDKVAIEVTWTNEGNTVSCAIEDLVMNRETKQPMVRGTWIYNGSNFSEGAFTAQRDGSIVSIHIDPDALINNPRPGRENDDLHQPHTARLPLIGTPVEIRIRLLERDAKLERSDERSARERSLKSI